MKQYLKVVGLTMAMLFILIGSAMASPVTYTFTDNTIYWPGYASGNTSWDTHDQVGNPQISGLSVTTDNGMLKSITVYETHREVDSTLFINTGYDAATHHSGAYGNWDYVVNYGSHPLSSYYLYSVNNPANYTYVMAFGPVHRPNHPYNILATDLTAASGFTGYNSTTGSITYNFDETIAMYPGFQIGYTPYCANDVTLTPEPSVLMLLGLGLLGLAGMRRRFKK